MCTAPLDTGSHTGGVAPTGLVEVEYLGLKEMDRHQTALKKELETTRSALSQSQMGSDQYARTIASLESQVVILLGTQAELQRHQQERAVVNSSKY